MEDLLEHLSDGAPVSVPYAYVGHFAADSAHASPEVEEFLGAGEADHPFHEASPVEVVRLENQGILVVTLDRMAHRDQACERCKPVWEKYRARLEGLPPETAISGAFEVMTEAGPGKLLVDAEDLPDEFFEEGDDDAEG